LQDSAISESIDHQNDNKNENEEEARKIRNWELIKLKQIGDIIKEALVKELMKKEN